MTLDGGTWLSVEAFADQAGIVRRVATKAATRALKGKSWRGCQLVVRRSHGRGGRSGLRYEVLLESLPVQFHPTLGGFLEVSKKPLKPAAIAPKCENQMPRAMALYSIIENAICHPAGSPERIAEVRAAVQRSGKGQRTIERYIAAFEREGLAGLMRKKPADAGSRRVWVSERFDQAFRDAGHDPAILPELADHVDLMLRSLWASRAADGGWRDLGRLAEHTLLQECERRGIELPQSAYSLGRRRVEKDRKTFEKINMMRTDAKRFADEMPRINRAWHPCDPMQIVVIDVHHMNVPVLRADGSTGWPKMVGFMDAGTGRIFCHFVLCESRTSIRQEHVIEGFIAMAMHREWGFPQNLYIDNGSENKALERITPALALIQGSITKAMPYNAAAKPIEPMFARLNRYCFSKMPGYAGDDRMRKKTQNVGKDTIPYQGSWAQFTADCDGLIAYYHQRAIGGQWGNRSPNQIFQEKIDAGWRPIRIDPLALDTAFCDRRSYKLSRGAVRINGRGFSHDALLRLPHGEKVEIALPWRREAEPVALLPDGQSFQLLPDYAYAPHDRDGAVASGRRKQTYRRTLRAAIADTVPLDPVAIASEIGARAAPIIIPGRAHVLDQGSAVQAVTDARAEAAEIRHEEMTEAQRAKARRDRITQNLLRKQANAA